MRFAQTPHHLKGKLGLGLELHLLRHAGLLAPASVARPFLRQIESLIHQAVSLTADIGQENPDLAVVHLAQGARVLALDPHGFVALFGEAGIVHHQHSVRVSKMLGHHVLKLADQLPVIPGRVADELLHRLNVCARHGACQFGSALAHPVQKKAVQPLVAPVGLPLLVEKRRETAVKLQQLLCALLYLLWFHLCHLHQSSKDDRGSQSRIPVLSTRVRSSYENKKL